MTISVEEKTTDKDSPWYMAGTEGTGQYLVLCRTKLGRIGVRRLGDSSVGKARYRVRVEPTEGSTLNLPPDSGWKQPGDGLENRYSIVRNLDEVDGFVNAALAELETYGGSIDWNPDDRVKIWYQSYFESEFMLPVEKPSTQQEKKKFPLVGFVAIALAVATTWAAILFFSS